MILVIDASVAIKMLVVESDHEAALALAEDKENVLVAPDFVLVETGNALWKKVRTKQIDREQAASAVSDLLVLFGRLVPTTDLLSAASRLALELDHPMYDCLYLACADYVGGKVVTDDRRFRAAAQRRSEMFLPFPASL